MGLTKVFVGNLSFKTKDSDLASEFSSAGKVVSANIITRGPRSLGYGFVELESEEEAQRAVALMNKKNIDTREINVELARPRDEARLAERRSTPTPLRRGGRGRGRGDRGGRGRMGRGLGGGGGMQAPGSPGPNAAGTDGGDAPASNGEGGPVPGGPYNGGPGSPANVGAVREIGRGGGNYSGRGGRRYRPRGDFSGGGGGGGGAGGGAGGGGGGDLGGGEGLNFTPGSPSRGRGGRGRGRGGRGRGGYQRPYVPRESSKTVLYVASLPFTVEDDELLGLFKDLKPTKAYVVRAKNNRSKGFGFVEFANEDDQKAALAAAENLMSGDRNLIVKVAMTENRLEDAKEAVSADADTDANTSETSDAQAPEEINENKQSTS